MPGAAKWGGSDRVLVSGERVGEEGSECFPVTLCGGLVINGEVSHCPAVQSVGVGLAAVVNAGVCQRLLEPFSHFRRVGTVLIGAGVVAQAVGWVVAAGGL